MSFSYEEARKRIPTQLEKIVNFLKDVGEDGATNKELSQICLQYDARVSDLRRKGFEIDVQSFGKGLYKYFLIKTPSQEQFFQNANDITFETIEKHYGGLISTFDLKMLLDRNGFHIIRKHGWYKNKQLH